MLLLVLQDGGVVYQWSDLRAIGLIIGFVLSQAAFWILQTRLGDNATIPTRLIKTRTIYLGMVTNFAIGAAFFTVRQAQLSGLTCQNIAFSSTTSRSLL